NVWPLDRCHERSCGQHIALAEIEQGLGAVRQIRQAGGTRMEIGIESHFRRNRFSIERIARALEPYNIMFIEDPIAPTNLDEIKLFSQRSPIPVIGSELLMTRWQVREWLEKHVSQILMTDPVWNGGIDETRKMA